MPIVTTSLTALAIAASVLAPVGAATAATPTSVSQSQTVSAVPSVTSVDWFTVNDRIITGTATPGAETVRITGLHLAAGVFVGGSVAADGTFAVDLAQFANRAMPFSTLTATAVAADGTLGGSSDFVVELSGPPAAKAESASSAQAGTGIQVDAITAGATTITGHVPAGTRQIAAEAYGSIIRGQVAADGSFTINLGYYAAYALVGVTFEVWGVDATGGIIPSQFVPVTA